MSTQPDKPPPVVAGTVIAGKYRVGGVIASGGMGVVMRATHVDLDQEVAIKFLHPEVAEIPSIRERFLREARSAARLRSDHVVRVFDVGVHDSIPYMAMESLQGSDLAAELSVRGPLPIREAVNWIIEALDAVAEAHQAGIVHRDLKPSNLFLVTRTSKSRGRVKVLDFGISKVESEQADGALTGTGLMLGSPSYMSPEQVRDSRSVDARTDVWSMAVILWELLSGQPAFPGHSVGDIFAKIREEPLPPIRTLRPDVPVELEAVISRCLDRDREGRFRDAAEMRDALARFGSVSSTRPPPPVVAHPQTLVVGSGGEAISGVTTVAVEPSGAASVPPALHQDTISTWSGERRSHRRSLLWVAGAAVLLIAGVTALAWPRATRPTEAQPSARPEAVATPHEPTITPVPAESGPIVEPAPPEAPTTRQPPVPASASAKAPAPKKPSGTKVSSPLPPPAAPKPKPAKDDLGI